MIEAAGRDAFRLTADPAFFWRHGQYARAFDVLRAAVLAGERFAVLTGDAGTGKTTLVNALGESLGSDGVAVGRLMFGPIDTAEMWSALARALRLEGLESREAFTKDGRAAFCTLCAGARARVVIVDEAQTLAPGALVELERLAQVLSPGERPILSVLLVGLPELRARLESAECAGLGERIGTRVDVADLSAAEVPSYIRHRLKVAGASPELLPADVVGRIATASGGTPARINQMCHALVAGFTGMPEPVTASPPPAVPRDWLGGGRWPPARIGLIVAGVAALGIAVFAVVHGRSAAPPPPAVVAPTAPVAPPVDATPPHAEPPETQVHPALTPPPAAGDVKTSVAPPADTAPSPRTTRKSATPPPPTAPPPSAPTRPRRQDDQPDASDVIDWLLKEGSARR